MFYVCATLSLFLAMVASDGATEQEAHLSMKINSGGDLNRHHHEHHQHHHHHRNLPVDDQLLEGKVNSVAEMKKKTATEILDEQAKRYSAADWLVPVDTGNAPRLIATKPLSTPEVVPHHRHRQKPNLLRTEEIVGGPDFDAPDPVRLTPHLSKETQRRLLEAGLPINFDVIVEKARVAKEKAAEKEKAMATTTKVGNKTANKTEPAAEVTTAAPTDSGGGNMIIIVVPVMLVIGVLIVCMLLMSKKKGMNNDEAIRVSYQYQAPPKDVGRAPVDVDRELRAALKIQAVFRGWKVRRMIRKKLEEEGLPRPLADKQKVCLEIEVVKGDKMPDVNTFGGCDPFVELRIAPGGDPLKRSGNDVPPPLKKEYSVKTQVKTNDKSPQWAEKLQLEDCANMKDTYFHVILWDYNLTGNTAIGHTSMTIAKACDKLAFKIKDEKPEQNKFRLKMRPLLPPDNSQKIEPTVDIKLNYIEVVKLRIHVASASRLPKVKTLLGTINSYIELRIVRQSPRKKEFSRYPIKAHGPGCCIWDGRTNIIQDSMDPNYKQDFDDIEILAYRDLYLQMILWDSNAPLLDSPICHTEIALADIISMKPGADLVEHQLKFSRLDGADSGQDFKKAKLKVLLTFNQVFERK